MELVTDVSCKIVITKTIFDEITVRINLKFVSLVENVPGFMKANSFSFLLGGCYIALPFAEYFAASDSSTIDNKDCIIGIGNANSFSWISLLVRVNKAVVTMAVNNIKAAMIPYKTCT
jgi:hypothetical protein